MDQLPMEEPHIAVLPRLLGGLFYYPPSTSQGEALIDSLGNVSTLHQWAERDGIAEVCQRLATADRRDLDWQFSVLFEGQGAMTAPPWGSVYQDRDNLVMGESTDAYRRFLAQRGLTFAGSINEPEDQFGLMLLALAALLERCDEHGARVLLEEHLLPWSDRYLERLESNKQSAFYADLAKLTSRFLSELKQRYALTPREVVLHF